MGLAETAKMIAQLDLSGNFVKNLGSANKALGSFDARLDRSQSHAYQVGQGIGNGIKAGAVLAAAGVGFVTANVVAGVRSLEDLEKATAQTNAVLKSTQNAAGQTADSIRNLAEKYEALNATVDDKVIQSGENVLLTFTAIRKQAFEPALLAALNMSTALKTDLQPAVLQIGKALQDPIKGLTALKKAGVNVTDDFKAQIAAFFKYSKTELTQRAKLKGAALKQFDAQHRLNATYKAQQRILAELNTEFGGSFLAGGQTTAAKIKKFQDAIEGLQQALAKALLPTIGNVADALTTLLSDPQTVKDVENFGKELAKFLSPENIRAGIDALKSGFTTLKDIASTVAGVIGTAVSAFTSLPPEVKQLLVGGFVANKLTGGLVTNLIGGAADFVFKKLGLMTVQAAVVNVNGGIAGGIPGGGVAGAAGKGLSGASKLFLVGEAIGLVAAVEGVREEISTGATKFSQDIANQTMAFIASNPNPAALQTALAGVEQGINDLQSNPLNVLVQGDALDNLKKMRADLVAALAKIPGIGQLDGKPINKGRTSFSNVEANRGRMADALAKAEISVPKVQQGIDALKGKITDDLALVRTVTDRGADNVKNQVSSTGNILYAGQYGAAAGIIGAIQRNRPNFDINVNVSGTTVRATTTVNDRGGSPDSDRKGSGYKGGAR